MQVEADIHNPAKLMDQWFSHYKLLPKASVVRWSGKKAFKHLHLRLTGYLNHKRLNMSCSNSPIRSQTVRLQHRESCVSHVQVDSQHVHHVTRLFLLRFFLPSPGWPWVADRLIARNAWELLVSCMPAGAAGCLCWGACCSMLRSPDLSDCTATGQSHKRTIAIAATS